MAALSSKRGRDRLLARLLEPRTAQLRRDLRMIVADLRGERAPPWLARDGARYAASPRRSVDTRVLEVRALEREAEALSLTLRAPEGEPLPRLRPGQFFTLLWPSEVPGAPPQRRAYSISSDCRERDQLRLTIKRVPGGRVSQAIYAAAEIGMRVELLGPSGSFGVEPEPERTQARKLVLIAGGSGITPMMAITHTLLGVESSCEIALIYASRHHAQVIHGEELRELARTHAPRLTLIEVYDEPPADWSGAVGPATPEVLGPLLDALPIASEDETRFMLCGPRPMMDGASELLRARGVAAERISRESFLAGQRSAKPLPRTPQALTLSFEGPRARDAGVLVQPGQTILDAGLADGLPMPYSCTMGGCGACKVVLERGEVDMPEPNCLSEAERARGQILACIARPHSACRVRVPEGGS